eukprot:992959_1
MESHDEHSQISYDKWRSWMFESNGEPQRIIPPINEENMHRLCVCDWYYGHKHNKQKTSNTQPVKPDGIHGHLSNLVQLRHGLSHTDYQNEDVHWMCYNWHESRSVLLGHEIGLGNMCPYCICIVLSTLIHWK